MRCCPTCKGTGELPDVPSAERLSYMQDRWFYVFWSVYPRHVGKAAALKAWKRAAASERIKDEILAGLKAQLATKAMQPSAGGDKSFIPHASTWLNYRRWEDEQAIIKTPQVRVIACKKCGDSGVVVVENGLFASVARCSCERGNRPGLILGEIHPDDLASV